MKRIGISVMVFALLAVSAALAGQNEWTKIGLDGTSVYGFVTVPGSPSTLYATTSAGLQKSEDGGFSWNALSLGVQGAVGSIAVDRSDPATLYATVNSGSPYSSGPADGIYRSVDAGATWSRVYTPAASADGFGKVFAIVSTDAAVIAAIHEQAGCVLDFCVAAIGSVLRSTDRGVTWHRGSPNFRGRVFVADPSDGSTVYAGAENSGSVFTGYGGGGVYRSSDGGATWVLALRGSLIGSLAIDPSDSRTVYAADNLNGVYKTTDGGATWENVSEEPIRRLAIDPTNRAVLYGAGDGGAFLQSGDGGRSWFRPGGLNDLAYTVAGDDADPARILVGAEFGLYEYRRATGACAEDETTLCLNDGRFRASVVWRTSDGRGGDGQAVGLTADTGYFWFRTPSDVELAVKVLSGPTPGSFWVFGGALTDVEYTIRVEDTQTGQAHGYHNALGRMSSFADTSAFPARADAESVEIEAVALESAAGDASLGATYPCTAGPATLCLHGGRFRVEVAWQTGDGRTGTGTAVSLTPETGYFFFFDPSNVELVIKVLDGRPIDGHFWVFYGALSDVAYTITVTDTETGIARTYSNPLGSLASVGDTKAF